jgi:hypothetical protein
VSDSDDRNVPQRNAQQQLDEVLAWHMQHGWWIVWRRGDDVLLTSWPPLYDCGWETRLRRWLRLAHPAYDRWWIDDAGVLRSARSNARGRILGSVSGPE